MVEMGNYATRQLGERATHKFWNSLSLTNLFIPAGLQSNNVATQPYPQLWLALRPMLYPTIDFLKARFRFLLVRGIARFHSLYEHPSFLRRSCSQLVASLNPTPPALSSLFSTIQVVFGRPLFLFPVHIKCNFGYPITGLLKHSIICLFVFFFIKYREEQFLRHVAMEEKFQISTNRIPANMVGKKTDMYDFPVHDCAQEQNGSPYIVRQCKWPSLSRKIVEIQKFCHHGNILIRDVTLLSIEYNSSSNLR